MKNYKLTINNDTMNNNECCLLPARRSSKSEGGLIRKLLIAFLFLALGFSSQAQMLYNGIYWVDGRISPPANDTSVSTNGRIVVFYQTTPGDGYAMDTSGPTGLSGRTGEFMLNAMEDWRMTIAPGTYRIAIVKGLDNYGVNPVEVTISGKGWDTINLQLEYGAGITMPGQRVLPDWLASEIPVIESIKFDGRLYQKILVDDPSKPLKFYTSAQPKISVTVTIEGTKGIDKNRLSVEELDLATMVPTVFSYSSGKLKIDTDLPNEVVFSLDYKDPANPPPALREGDHVFTFSAGNDVGSTDATAKVTVKSGIEIIGIPITYPSPLHLATQNQVTFQYGLSRDANIDIYVFDITGTVVKKLSFSAGSPGGQGGGSASPNRVTWNLITDQGSRLGVGIYLWEIVNRDSNKIIGKGKLPVAP